LSLPLNVAANVDRDAVQPRREFTPILEAMEVLVQPQKNLLCGILGVLQVTQQSETGGQDLPLMKQDNLLKCGGISSLCLSQPDGGWIIVSWGTGVQTGVFDHQDAFSGRCCHRRLSAAKYFFIKAILHLLTKC
jgi:hypothetical protein